MPVRGGHLVALVGAASIGASVTGPAAATWEPTRPVEVLVGFAPGGAADQMARAIQAIIAKRQLMKQPMIVINKPAAAGADAMLDLKAAAGDPHKLLIVNSSLYTTPMSSRLQVGWRQFTPVAMLAQDDFVLWVNTKAPYESTKDFLGAVRKAQPVIKFGGSGAKREDHFISLAVGREAGGRIAYIPYPGGGPASVQLAGGHIDANVNNPAEEIANWRAGLTRPLCVFSPKAMGYTAKVTDGGQSWTDIQPCPTQGLNFTYQMLRGYFMPADVSPEQLQFFVDLLRKVSETSDWREYLNRNALTPDLKTGTEFNDFLTVDEERHRELMEKAGFLAPN